MKKILIVCNSVNPDLVNYFKCKSTLLKNMVVVFKNRKIKLDQVNVYNSSYMNKAFLDKFVILDFFLSFYLFVIIFINKIKVIHFTTAHISNIFLSVLLKPFGIKQIFTIHDLSPHPGNKSGFITLYNKFVINILADEILSFSHSEIEKQDKKDKFKYFPLSGFKLNVYKPKSGEKMILFFGRMEPYKGFENLLKIIEMSNEQRTGFTFVIAGKGFIPNKNNLKRMNNVEIINRFINDDEIEKLFKQATYTILPYDSATQSGVSILSFSYATPVIAYDVGALGEYIKNGNTGYCVDYRNNQVIIDILKNTNNQKILDMSKNVIIEFQNKYSTDSCKRQYFEYYKTLLGE